MTGVMRTDRQPIPTGSEVIGHPLICHDHSTKEQQARTAARVVRPRRCLFLTKQMAGAPTRCNERSGRRLDLRGRSRMG